MPLLLTYWLVVQPEHAMLDNAMLLVTRVKHELMMKYLLSWMVVMHIVLLVVMDGILLRPKLATLELENADVSTHTLAYLNSYSLCF